MTNLEVYKTTRIYTGTRYITVNLTDSPGIYTFKNTLNIRYLFWH